MEKFSVDLPLKAIIVVLCRNFLLTLLLVVGQTAQAVPVLGDLITLRDAGQFKQAVHAASMILDDDPDNVDVLLLRGQTQSFLGHFSDAEADLRHAAALAPGYVDVRLTLARVLGYQRRYSEAISQTQTALEQAPGRVDGWLMIARYAAALEDDPLRGMAINRAHEINPDDPELLIEQGNWAFDQRRYQDAQEFYQRRLTGHGFDQVTADRLAEIDKRHQPWTFTTTGSASNFDEGGRENWQEWFNELSYKLDTDRTLRGRTEYSERFGSEDLYLSGSLDQAINRDLTLSVLIGATPDADFRPKTRAGVDLSWRIWRSSDTALATVLGGGIELSRYSDGTTKSLRVGVTQYFSNFWLTANLVNVMDEAGSHDIGWNMRADLSVTDNVRLFTGGGIENDREFGQSRLTRTVFGGLIVRLNQRVNWFFDAAVEHVERGAQRRAASSGFSVAF